MIDIEIARVCHQTNKAYCEEIGDDSPEDWEDAPGWQRESAINGVQFHINNPDASNSASHDNWMAEKVADGWVYGETKDPEAKTHHCIVPFGELPKDQQIKDVLFRNLVHILHFGHTPEIGALLNVKAAVPPTVVERGKNIY